MGRILIVEGIEKAERGIMPLLNNLLENREMSVYLHHGGFDCFALIDLPKESR
jgi:hypothetical protein